MNYYETRYNNVQYGITITLLSVAVAPAHVTISGPTEARVGDIVPLTCVTAGSNPPADIKWLIGGKTVRNATQRHSPAPEGGWITTSNTTAVVDTDKRALVVICHGLNMQLSENIVSTHTINVLCKLTLVYRCTLII